MAARAKEPVLDEDAIQRCILKLKASHPVPSKRSSEVSISSTRRSSEVNISSTRRSSETSRATRAAAHKPSLTQAPAQAADTARRSDGRARKPRTSKNPESQTAPSATEAPGYNYRAPKWLAGGKVQAPQKGSRAIKSNDASEDGKRHVQSTERILNSGFPGGPPDSSGSPQEAPPHSQDSPLGAQQLVGYLDHLHELLQDDPEPLLVENGSPSRAGSTEEQPAPRPQAGVGRIVTVGAMESVMVPGGGPSYDSGDESEDASLAGWNGAPGRARHAEMQIMLQPQVVHAAANGNGEDRSFHSERHGSIQEPAPPLRFQPPRTQPPESHHWSPTADKPSRASARKVQSQLARSAGEPLSPASSESSPVMASRAAVVSPSDDSRPFEIGSPAEPRGAYIDKDVPVVPSSARESRQLAEDKKAYEEEAQRQRAEAQRHQAERERERSEEQRKRAEEERREAEMERERMAKEVQRLQGELKEARLALESAVAAHEGGKEEANHLKEHIRYLEASLTAHQLYSAATVQQLQQAVHQPRLLPPGPPSPQVSEAGTAQTLREMELEMRVMNARLLAAGAGESTFGRHEAIEAAQRLRGHLEALRHQDRSVMAARSASNSPIQRRGDLSPSTPNRPVMHQPQSHLTPPAAPHTPQAKWVSPVDGRSPPMTFNRASLPTPHSPPAARPLSPPHASSPPPAPPGSAQRGMAVHTVPETQRAQYVQQAVQHVYHVKQEQVLEQLTRPSVRASATGFPAAAPLPVSPPRSREALRTPRAMSGEANLSRSLEWERPIRMSDAALRQPAPTRRYTSRRGAPPPRSVAFAAPPPRSVAFAAPPPRSVAFAAPPPISQVTPARTRRIACFAAGTPPDGPRELLQAICPGTGCSAQIFIRPHPAAVSCHGSSLTAQHSP
ncbi:hypothetical protein CYMTET_10675 [Cymbomonas tetramitiformis]|uniref:Uncharacterized protein n=1 Tax=Cymbomonas tetramitiformis TaxID=36881 RepID=A0AAE0GNQ1_9CHLO|nr:hypothetical protein CYMTET_10675 [Cymbomonas tetramitiformis]